MPYTDVVAAVMLDAAGRFLLACRPQGKAYAGYWEFPGGKVHVGEALHEALARELREELSIEVREQFPWISRTYVYPHASVRLHFFRVTQWSGTARPLEGQALEWQQPGAASVTPMLPANAPVLRALTLPSVYAITHAGELGVERQLEALDRALESGLRLIQVREPAFDQAALTSFARAVVQRAQAHGARVLVNARSEVAADCGADGIHLPARQLMALKQRPEFALVGASCHDATELEQAQRLEVDFAVLGPVRATPSHPQAAPLDWERFAHHAQFAQIPIYALGGLTRGDIRTAWEHGGHGVALMRAAW